MPGHDQGIDQVLAVARQAPLERTDIVAELSFVRQISGSQTTISPGARWSQTGYGTALKVTRSAGQGDVR